MNVGSIGLETVAGSQATAKASSATSAAAAREQDAARGASISQPAELLSKLGELQAKDPEKFGEVAGAVASGLKDAASKATGGDATKLHQMSEDISRAHKALDVSAARAKRLKGKLRPKPAHRAQAASGPVKSALDAAIAKVDTALATPTVTATASSTTGRASAA